MATKRMFSKSIVGSDAFMDMPPSTRELYFQLGMEADDDGFIGNPKRIVRGIGATDNDYDLLKAKKFVLVFPSGVLVIKHHRINNNWDKYNCKRTPYIEEFKQLAIKENMAYTLDISQGEPLQSANSLLTVSRREENKGEENRIEERRGEIVATATTPKEEAIKFFKMVKENGDEFHNYLQNFKSNAEGARLEINKFTLYWTELNPTGKKERWQQEKTFEVKKRLATWFSKVKNFSKSGSSSKYKAVTI